MVPGIVRPLLHEKLGELAKVTVSFQGVKFTSWEWSVVVKVGGDVLVA